MKNWKQWQILFWGAPKSLKMVTAAMKFKISILKDVCCSLQALALCPLSISFCQHGCSLCVLPPSASFCLFLRVRISFAPRQGLWKAATAELQTNTRCQLSRLRRASLVAQMVKDLPEIWEIRVQSLCWEDPLEEGMATHSSILAWRICIDREAWRVTVHGVTSVGHD